MADAACTQEEDCLCEGVGNEVEHCDADLSRAERQHHETQVADGRIGEDALHVGHDHGDHGGSERGGNADRGDQVEYERREFVEREEDGHEKYACGDHGCGVDEGADRGWAFHCVRQPDVERDLGGFARGAKEYEEHRPVEDVLPDLAGLRGLKDRGHFKCAGLAEEEDDADQQADVADARGDECLFRRL